MLKKILSISGKPGLYKLISYGKNMVIVEGLADGKRMPAYNYNKIVSLGDISIYTTNDDVPLADVLQAVYDKQQGQPVDKAAVTKTADALHDFFASVLPNYDTDRVYDTDIKKLVSWYNILVGASFTSFKEEKAKDETPADAQEETTK